MKEREQAPVADRGERLNRAGRRKADAIARKQRHLFNRYKAHMKDQGYDATFDDFVKSMPQ
jgi:hypothetical protein